jgi:hypothetical protein
VLLFVWQIAWLGLGEKVASLFFEEKIDASATLRSSFLLCPANAPPLLSRG